MDNLSGNHITVHVEASHNTSGGFEINGDLDYNPVLLVYTHDNRDPYLIATLTGGNTRAEAWHFNIYSIKKDNFIVIEGGEYGNPLRIKPTIPRVDGKISVFSIGGIDITKRLRITPIAFPA